MTSGGAGATVWGSSPGIITTSRGAFRIMKAMRILSPGVVEQATIAEPNLQADSVMLRVAYVGYCGSDLNTFRGLNPMVVYPRIPGHEISGVIEAVGLDVPAEWKPGMAVTLSPYTSCGACSACRAGRYNCCRDNQTLGVQRDGALTERLVVPWRKLFSSPRLSLRELALVEPLTVGCHAVDRGRVTAEDTVCVLGCGAIGLGAIAGAAWRKARVIAVDIDNAKLGIARQAGAAESVNSATEDFHERLQALTGGDGPNVIIEAIGLPQTFRAAVEEVAFAGRVVYIGYARKPVDYESKYFVQKELDILGSRNATPADFRQVITMLESGCVPVDAIISREVPPDQAGDMLRQWSDNPGPITKILIHLSD